MKFLFFVSAIKTKKTMLHYFRKFLSPLLVSIVTYQTAPAQNATTLKIGDPAPTFVLKDSSGADIFLRDYCGSLRQPWKNKTKHVVMLSFFATWCQPCLKEIPELEKLAVEFRGQNLKIFLIDLKEQREPVQKFCRENNITLPVLFDKYGVVAGKYQATSLPRLFVIGREGRIVWQSTGYQENFPVGLSELLKSQFQ